MKWLFKEEPDHYSYDELARDRKTVWSGVRNPLAQKHLRSVRKGDLIFYYHTGKEKAVVGIARAVSDPYPDPEEPSGSRVAVDVAPVRQLAHPVPLATIKATRSLAALPLVRLPRLSVMPVGDREWTEIEKLSEGPPKANR
jgi:predicted RNA-binding protein with PUA-like domain